MEDDQLREMRTRWRRWLGNKTAFGKDYWTTLLDSRWSSWCQRVCEDQALEYNMSWNREGVKEQYSRCIDIATFKHLLELDGIYAAEKAGL